MELTINVDALDKTSAAVNSATDRTVAENFEVLVLGNQEPLVLSFLDDDGATPSWVTDPTVSMAVGVGDKTVNGTSNYASTTALAIAGSTRTGSLNLNAALLRGAVYNKLLCGPRSISGIVNMTLEIRKESTNGIETLALLVIQIMAPVVPVVAPADESAADLAPLSVTYDPSTNTVLRPTALVIPSLTLGAALPVGSGGTGQTTLTANAVLLGNGSGAILSADLTYSTPTLSVPDAFNISSAGSIKLSPLGTSNVLIPVQSANMSGYTAPFAGLAIIGTTGEFGILVDGYGSITKRDIVGRYAGGTQSSPTALSSGNTMLGLSARGYDGSTYSGTQGSVNITANEAWASASPGPAARGTRILFTGTPKGSTTAISAMEFMGTTGVLRLTLGGSTADFPAWGGVGPQFNAGSVSTYRDNSSATGTVSLAVINSFNVATVNATNASVVYTTLANVYIAGDVATTGNASATTSYGLYNVGKTRLDGRTGIGTGATSTSILSLAASTTAVSSLNIAHGSAPTSPVNGDIWTTTAGLFVRINGATVGPLT